MLCRKCRLGCLIVLGDSESSESGIWNKSWCIGQVVGVAVWPGICRQSESRVVEAEWSMFRLLIQQLTGGFVEVSFEDSTIVSAVLSAHGLVLCTECPLHLAVHYVIGFLVMMRLNLPKSFKESKSWVINLKRTVKLKSWIAAGKKAGPWRLLLAAGKRCLVGVCWYQWKGLKLLPMPRVGVASLLKYLSKFPPGWIWHKVILKREANARIETYAQPSQKYFISLLFHYLGASGA